MGYGTLGMNANGCAAQVLIDAGTEAIVTTPDIHNGIHAGRVYNYHLNGSADASTSGAWVFLQTGASATYQTHMSIVGLATTADQFYLKLYEYDGVSGSAGMSSSGFSASATAKNRNRSTSALRSATGNVTFLTGSGFVTSSATLVDEHLIGGGTGVGGAKSGGTGPQDEEWVLKPDGQYAFYYANVSACANRWNLRLAFRDYDV